MVALFEAFKEFVINNSLYENAFLRRSEVVSFHFRCLYCSANTKEEICNHFIEKNYLGILGLGLSLQEKCHFLIFCSSINSWFG